MKIFNLSIKNNSNPSLKFSLKSPRLVALVTTECKQQSVGKANRNRRNRRRIARFRINQPKCTQNVVDRTLTAAELLFPSVTQSFSYVSGQERTWNIDSRLSKGGNTVNFRHEPEMTVPRLPTQSLPQQPIIRTNPSRNS